MIFISYRRSDGKATAQLIQTSLIERGFDKSDIFLDLHDILGEDFTQRCSEAISECDSFLLLVTKNSFSKKEGHDYYYDEIHQALDEKKMIVPVLYETEFNDNVIPEEFMKKGLHLRNAVRYDIEYQEDSLKKLIRALTINSKPPFLKKLAQWFAVPLVFITIYLGVSLIGGVIRFIWDNYWLSNDTCLQIATSHIIKGDNERYFYSTHDSLYIFNTIEHTISIVPNVFDNSNAALSITINRDDAFEAGFWTVAIGLVYEISKIKIKPHGNSKQVGVIIAATVSVAAGFGFGFVCERMMFPVHESRIIRKNLHSPFWWNSMIQSRSSAPVINRDF